MKQNPKVQPSPLNRSAKNSAKRKKRSNKKKIWFSILACVLLAGLSGYIFREQLIGFGFDHVVAPAVAPALDKSYVELKDNENSGLLTAKDSNTPFSLLLLGTDQRGQENGLSDSIIYTVIRPKDNRALFVSIPRDSYAKIIGAETVKGARKNTKINAAHSYGGPQMSVDTVGNLLDAPVEYFATINFNGLTEVVDELGGVELPITKVIENKNPQHEKLRIEPNKPIYSGHEALMYVRYREDSDFKRTERQRIFLKAVLDRMKNFDNIVNIQSILGVAGSNFKTNMKSEFILDLAKRIIMDGMTPQITSHMLKGEGSHTDQWYYLLDENDLEETHQLIERWLDPRAASADLRPASGED
ncbi:LCP family protein [Paenibacillus donghaensis]|uniref:Transcriptional regulator n=1 Tax=Paenibacillus donghaensis TaxID=414771 RepID=A0A2Z2KCM6_9BACL|nr:LCP family protein [Paenibacillus donghaensis]ASA23634.1 transcriptional regulator [Paenibacillus donghaensis]